MRSVPFFNNQLGMVLQDNNVGLDSRAADWIENLHLSATGCWTTDNIGNQLLATATQLGGTGSILSLHAIQEQGWVDGIVAQLGNRLTFFNPATNAASLVFNPLTATGPMRSVSFLGWKIFVGKGQAPLRWNGQTVAEPLPGWPPTIAGMTVGTPSLVTTFANRLVCSGDVINPSVVYLSALEDPEQFTPATGAASAGALQVNPGDGDAIVGLQRLFLPVSNEEVLVIFKQHAIYLLSGFSADNFTLQRVAQGVGAVNQESIVTVQGVLMFLTPDRRLMSLNTNLLQGNLSLEDYSGPIAAQLQEVSSATLGDSFASWLPDRGELWWWLPGGTPEQPRRVLVQNITQGGIGRSVWSLRTGLSARCATVLSSRLLSGNLAGSLQQQLTGSQYGTQPIRWRYRTPFYDLGQPGIRKRLRQVALYLQHVSQQGLEVATRWDFQPQPSEQRTLTGTELMLDLALLFGSAIYGQSRFGDASSATVRLVPAGSGQRVQLEWSGQLPQQPVSLAGWLVTTLSGGLS